MSSESSPLKFPCDFPIKAMGRSEQGFTELVVEIVRKHAPLLDGEAIQVRPSSGGKWVSVTITIRATNREQLDAIYSALSAHEKVVLSL